MSGSPQDDHETLPPFLDIDCGSQRRVRHITSIQVRNLTPFPVRDAFASALLQPSEQSQFDAHGHLSDDLDLTLGRKRSRRISANSLNTLRSRNSEDGVGREDVDVGSPDQHRGRMRLGSRVSFSSGGNSGPGANAGSSRRSVNGVATSLRPANRPRTGSSVSFQAIPSLGSVPPQASPAARFSAMLPDNSQRGLEKVINSRLVETFLSITVPSASSPTSISSTENNEPIQSSSRPTTPHNSSPSRDKFSVHRRRGSSITQPRGSKMVPSSNLSDTSKVSTSNRHETHNSPKSTPNGKSFTSPRPGSSSSRSDGKSHVSSTSVSSQRSLTSGSSPLSPSHPTHTSMVDNSADSTLIPNHLSAIHRPSTNPSFPINTQSRSDFAEWTDVSGQKLHLEVWGRVGSYWPGAEGPDEKSKGKGKEKQAPVDQEISERDWKVLEQWNIDLEELVPLPVELATHPSHLPSNTLLVTLAPHGHTYYIPSPLPPSRPVSPSGGYNSDPEAGSGVRNVRNAAERSSLIADMKPAGGTVARQRGKRRNGGSAADSSKGGPKTAGWQDLLKLVDLQTIILDTEGSLASIVGDIDASVEVDVTSVLKRETSERETQLEELRAQRDQVVRTTADLHAQISLRRDQLQQRKQTLELARQAMDQELSEQSAMEDTLIAERNGLEKLRNQLTPIRTTLVTTLSAIYPIDLLSPPDLLFTILSAPLPIPLTVSDPGPPLSLLDHKEVNEDAIATALGYAAQVVHFLAVYLGKTLVYPVTCIGSRSLIRDGISAMVGPRMFPLFSKGVDTYRFEYGVFLLNKDIEMLMVDRDLRALDMRHTLPNLKNLLLTLTDSEGARLATPRVSGSPISATSGLESPRAKSPPLLKLTPSSPPVPDDSQQPDSDLVVGSTPPSSGATTPTAATNNRQSRSLLGLYPLSGFFRTRNSSVASSAKSVAETPEETSANGDLRSTSPSPSNGQGSTVARADDDEDRRTIRGNDNDGEPDGKQGANGYPDANGDVEPGQGEKARTVRARPTTPRTVAPNAV